MKKILSLMVMLALCGAAMAQMPRVKGDVNGDGSVTSVDVTVLYNYLLGETSALQNGDVDSDGYITSGDVTFVYNILLGIEPAEEEHEYVDLDLPSGTLWATMNIGANSPEEYGDYFAWGETTPKEIYKWSTYKWCNGYYTTMTKYCIDSSYGYNGFTDGKTELDPEDDAATANWGPQWRMPSSEQIQELLYYCSSWWTTMNGVNVRCYHHHPNGAILILPAAGYWDSSLNWAGVCSHYWSRTIDVGKMINSCDLMLNSSYCNLYSDSRRYGFTVRAVRVAQK